MRHPLRIAPLSLAAVLLLAGPPLAQAGALDDAKAAGYVGESEGGMLGLVRADAPEDVKALVRDINAKRLASYEAIAKRNGAPVEGVAAQAGAKLIQRTPAGHYVMRGGKWVKK